jgi:biotin carboxylase
VVAERFGILCVAPSWTSPPRTARQLALHGAEVCMIAPPGSYAALTRFKSADILMPSDEIGRKLPAILRTLAEAFGARSVLAGDNGAFTLLAQLVSRAGDMGLSEATRAMLTRSMPEARLAAQLAIDSAFITAPHEGLPPPRTLANPQLDEAVAFAAAETYPVVLKRDGSAAGTGVSICANEMELRAAFDAAQGAFVLQAFVRGQVYGVAVSGVGGKAVAAVSFAKHQVWPEPQGPATVIRCDRRDDLIADACRLYETYGLNGYAGFDYIVGEDGRAFLLEANPYIVEGHVSGCFGCDLTAAMLAALRGEAPAAVRAPSHEFVAFFPNEWSRDAQSVFLASAYHDVPWDDAALLEAMMRDCIARPGRVGATIGA